MSTYRVTFTETRRFCVSVGARDDADAVQQAAVQYRAHCGPSDWQREHLRGVTAVHWENVERVGGYEADPVRPCGSA